MQCHTFSLKRNPFGGSLSFVNMLIHLLFLAKTGCNLLATRNCRNNKFAILDLQPRLGKVLRTRCVIGWENENKEFLGSWKSLMETRFRALFSFEQCKMAAGKSREGTVGNRLTPVLRIELSPIQELKELHRVTYRTNVTPKSRKSRKDYDQKLQEKERIINKAAGGEPYITLENRVDFVKFPEHFNYTRKNLPGPGVQLWPDPAYIVACDCNDKCTESGCSCPLYSGSEFAYDEHGRVTIERRRPIYECNQKCPCGKNCRNRVVQRGRSVRVSFTLQATLLDSFSLTTDDFICQPRCTA
jgi:hypothetical protein